MFSSPVTLNSDMLQLSLQLPFCLEIWLTWSLFYPQIPKFPSLCEFHIFASIFPSILLTEKSLQLFLFYFIFSLLQLLRIYFLGLSFTLHMLRVITDCSRYVQDISTSQRDAFLDLCSQYFSAAYVHSNNLSFFSILFSTTGFDYPK